MRKITISKPRYRCELQANGVISGLFANTLPKQNLVPAGGGWGCEIGNWYGSFSQSKHLRRKSLIKHKNNQEYSFRFKVNLPCGRRKDSWFQVDELLKFGQSSITQEFTFEIKSKTAQLGDLVNRFVFEENLLPRATLGNKKIPHCGTNIYYQVPLTDVQLAGHKVQITVKNNKMLCPTGYDTAFDKTIYLRDEPTTNYHSKRWVVHARLISARDYAGNYVARWFYPNVILPQPLTQVLASGSLKQSLWRLRERFPLSPINLGSIMYVKGGDKFTLRSTVQIKTG